MKGSIFPSMGWIRWGVGGGVIVVLLLVAWGNFARSRADAVRASEARVLQQWGIALNLYLIENENQLPDVGETPVTPEQKKAWYNVLPPYISEKPLAELLPGERPRPGEPSIWVRATTKPVKIWDPQVFYFSHGMNRYLQPVADRRSFRIYEISFPGSVIFLAPVNGYSPAAEPSDVVFPKEKDPVVPVLFCDGHVTRVSKSLLLSPGALEVPKTNDDVSWFKQ